MYMYTCTARRYSVSWYIFPLLLCRPADPKGPPQLPDERGQQCPGGGVPGPVHGHDPTTLTLPHQLFTQHLPHRLGGGGGGRGKPLRSERSGTTPTNNNIDDSGKGCTRHVEKCYDVLKVCISYYYKIILIACCTLYNGCTALVHVHHTAGDMVQLCTLQLCTSYCRAYGTAGYIILQGIWYSCVHYSCVHHTAGHMVQLCTSYCRGYGTAVYIILQGIWYSCVQHTAGHMVQLCTCSFGRS